jgi:hypothetical protein
MCIIINQKKNPKLHPLYYAFILIFVVFGYFVLTHYMHAMLRNIQFANI